MGHFAVGPYQKSQWQGETFEITPASAFSPIPFPCGRSIQIIDYYVFTSRMLRTHTHTHTPMVTVNFGTLFIANFWARKYV